jgi:hypothetical protein
MLPERSVRGWRSSVMGRCGRNLMPCVEQLGLGDRVTFLGRLPKRRPWPRSPAAMFLSCRASWKGCRSSSWKRWRSASRSSRRESRDPGAGHRRRDGAAVHPLRLDRARRQISALTNDKQLRQRLGAAGPLRIAEEFDVRRSAEAIRRLFHQAVPSAATALEHRSAPGSGTWAASTAGKAAAGSEPRG